MTPTQVLPAPKVGELISVNDKLGRIDKVVVRERALVDGGHQTYYLAEVTLKGGAGRVLVHCADVRAAHKVIETLS